MGNANDGRTLAVTGGTGFIARGVLESCAEAGLSCRALSRCSRPSWATQAVEWSTVPTYGDVAALTQALASVRYVVHLADNPARDDARNAAEAEDTCDALIEATRRNRVGGVIVASSVYAGREQDSNASSYGAVKRAIEWKFLSATDIRPIILRLPPVYGPGGRGGLAFLAKLVRKGMPLPLGAATAPRSYLSRRNLASLVVAMANAGDETWTHAANRIFEPSDDQVVATRDLIRMMGHAMGRRTRMLPIPVAALRMLGAITGRSELISGAVDRLDVAPVEELEAAFGWHPVERMPESLAFLGEELSRA